MKISMLLFSCLLALSAPAAGSDPAASDVVTLATVRDLSEDTPEAYALLHFLNNATDAEITDALAGTAPRDAVTRLLEGRWMNLGYRSHARLGAHMGAALTEQMVFNLLEGARKHGLLRRYRGIVALGDNPRGALFNPSALAAYEILNTYESYRLESALTWTAARARKVAAAREALGVVFTAQPGLAGELASIARSETASGAYSQKIYLQKYLRASRPEAFAASASERLAVSTLLKRLTDEQFFDVTGESKPAPSTAAGDYLWDDIVDRLPDPLLNMLIAYAKSTAMPAALTGNQSPRRFFVMRFALCWEGAADYQYRREKYQTLDTTFAQFEKTRTACETRAAELNRWARSSLKEQFWCMGEGFGNTDGVLCPQQ